MLKNPEIENYIELNGEEIPIDSLPEERRKELAGMLEEKIMESAGLKRIYAYRKPIKGRKPAG
ncbi:hypothetical protein [Lacrimispora sp. JR3]|uniref:hypothetical protein n=1 Tax=Lacrimispora sinapis TaxID=3111456 RepID=UPI00374A2DFC